MTRCLKFYSILRADCQQFYSKASFNSIQKQASIPGTDVHFTSMASVGTDQVDEFSGSDNERGKENERDAQGNSLGSDDDIDCECGDKEQGRIVCANIYNLFFVSILGRTGEVILTVGDFLGMLVVLAMILHFYVLLGTNNTFGIFLMWFCGTLSGNIALIPLWSFFRFSYFRDKYIPWKSVWKLFVAPRSWETPDRYENWDLSAPEYGSQRPEGSDQTSDPKENKGKWQAWPIFKAVIALLFIIFVVVSLSKSSRFFDIFMFVLIIILPLIKISLTFIGYLWNFWCAMFNCMLCGERARTLFFARHDKIRDPFIYSLYGTLRMWVLHIGKRCTCTLGIPDELENDGAKSDVPKRVTRTELVFEFLHLIASLVLVLSVIVLASKAKNLESGDKAKLAGFIIMLIVVFVPLAQIQFPFFLMSRLCPFNCGDGLFRSPAKMKQNEDFAADMMTNPRMKKLRIISMIVHCILLVLFILITAVWLIMTSTRQYSSLSFSKGAVYKYNGQPSEPTTDQKRKIVSQLCYVSPYRLKMIQVIALANAAYLNEEDLETLTTEFFNDTAMPVSSSDSMEINSSNHGAGAYFQFDTEDLTVVSFRGTSERLDGALDIQMFLSSALLTSSSILSLFTTTVMPFTNRQIKKVVASPLILVKPISLVDKYVRDLKAWYEQIPKKTNILFTGHSLGGGLAKLFGHLYGRPSIAVSGPGVTLLQQVYAPIDRSIWIDNDYESSLTSQTDVIPDLDVVPRVEISTGTHYRVLCNAGVFSCHSIDRTLCMTGIMCETEHEQFCRALEIGEDYDAARKLAKR